MSTFLLGVWQNAPIWVWPLFVVLVVVGLRAMRTRETHSAYFALYPLFVVTAAGMIDSLAIAPLNWIVFCIALLVSVALSFRWQDGLILRKSGRRMRLAGERVTLLVLMTIFLSNFVRGVLESMAPGALETPAFVALFAALIGASAGTFLGGALRVFTLGNREAVRA